MDRCKDLPNSVKSKRAYSLPRTFLSTISVVIILMLLLFLPLVFSVSADVSPDLFGSGIGRFNSIICEDVDGDGINEILFGSYEGYVVAVEFREGEYFLDWKSPKFGTRCWGLIAGQFDSDPAVEIIIGDGDGVVRAIDGKTKEIEWKFVELVRDAHGLLLHDLDDDGSNELVVGTGYKTDEGWGTVYFFNQKEEKPYDKIERLDPDLTLHSRLREFDIVDIDSDGSKELILGCGVSLGDIGGEGYVRVIDFENKKEEWISPDLGGCIEGLKVLDLNDDGNLEIIVTNGYRYREGFCYIYRYQEGEFQRIWKSPNIGPKAYGLDVGDIDDDGVNEIVIGNLAGYVYVFDGITHREEWRSENLGRDILGIALGDPDGDGDTEIIAGQGGYIGKGDFTSGYVTPHVYVIDGKSHKIEAVLGDVDEFLQWVQVGILIAIVVTLVEISIMVRIKTGKKTISKSGGQ
ncbi:MAG: hypothetical protein A7315_02900 [Candidatus Altiarchaeales archaeon WOR_SM1_79]|nr:MAG: hypothetical protein A7315_02900 [Candidatus Altiarchaeales archaeon WOR_SM1_79]